VEFAHNGGIEQFPGLIKVACLGEERGTGFAAIVSLAGQEDASGESFAAENLVTDARVQP
jgi:hypothetical protein